MHKIRTIFRMTSVMTSLSLLTTQQGYADALDDTTMVEAEEIHSSIDLAQTHHEESVHRQLTQPFTGKITKNKVRMRLHPSLDSPIVSELSMNDLVLVDGEAEDFYSIKPPAGVKGYIFRTYVLDGVIEGSHVNVRLAPDIASPIIGQMNAGDLVVGEVSAKDKKWMEIVPPADARFFIARDFVENLGDASLFVTLKKRREEIAHLLQSATQSSQVELQKPFEQIHLESIVQNLNKVIAQHRDFVDEAARAKELLASIQTTYLHKKLAYLEKVSQENAVKSAAATAAVAAAQKQQQEQQKITTPAVPTSVRTVSAKPAITHRMEAWVSVERDLYSQWSADHSEPSVEKFYQEQTEHAEVLSGILEPYYRSVKNKPGDYLLVSKSTHLPIAYLYSTKIDLQEKLGQEVTVQAAPRDAHHFAYPAYFVLSTDP